MNVSHKFHTQEETIAWARAMGARLRGGEVIELVGDLGSGKTTFTRGLVEGAGSTDIVASPTFTLRKEYHVPPKPGKTLRIIAHIDLYRLHDAGLMAHELADSMEDPTTTVVIEWADVAAHVLPEGRLTLRLMATGEQTREIDAQCPDNLAYLLEVAE